jgi:formyl-CoA transferase
LAALRHRELTGEGQVVDSALYEAVLQVMESLIPDYSVGGYVRERSGSILPGIAPSNVYQCADGEYLIGANQDSVFGRLCEAMGRPELAADPRYVDHVSRGRNQTELDDLINAWTRTLTIAQVEDLMIEHGIPAGRVYRPADILADPHVQAREAVVEVEHPRWQGLKMQSVFPRLSKSPGAIRSIAPQTVGQDNQSVLAEIGLDDEAVARLRQSGVV